MTIFYPFTNDDCTELHKKGTPVKLGQKEGTGTFDVSNISSYSLIFIVYAYYNNARPSYGSWCCPTISIGIGDVGEANILIAYNSGAQSGYVAVRFITPTSAKVAEITGGLSRFTIVYGII